jgi:YVTN family beta-propeller protein
MYLIVLLVLCCVIQSCNPFTSETEPHHTMPGRIDDSTMRLPNNWLLTPIGEHIEIGDLPLAIALHPDGRYAAITNSGHTPDYVSIIDLETRAEVQQIPIPHCWVGIEFSPNGKELVVAVTGRNTIYLYQFQDNRATLADSIVIGKQTIRERIYPAGLAYTPDGRHLVVANILQHTVSLLDVTSKSVIQTVPCDPFPNYVKVHPSGNRAYISTRGGNSVQVISLPDMRIIDTIPVGSRPNHMVFSPSGDRLFVTCANSDDVHVIDTGAHTVTERIDMRPYAGARPGTTSNGIAVTNDGSTLYVANADNNDIAVIDLRQSPARVKGRIPTGWYPTAVTLAHDNQQLLILSGKGLQSKANPKGPQPTQSSGPETQRIHRLLRGTLTMIQLATINDDKLDEYTATVARNNRWDQAQAAMEQGTPAVQPVAIPRRFGEPSPIKYVLYIIKENRTYDQIFGDLPQGNGDSSLCLFPEPVTPNHHKLATNWVLFDNFYTDAEVSMDGHAWTDGAIAVDYVEKTWPSQYSRQALFQATKTRDEGGSFWDYLKEDVANPDEGYIWDAARRKGLSIRSYWELPTVEGLQGFLAPDEGILDTTHFDTRRAHRYIAELREYEKNGGFPQFQVMALDNDHTKGRRPGELTPQACVGDNDQGLGMIIEALSHSKFWPEMAVFIVEDDAQNGPDHVDAHRTVAMIASPYAKRGFVDRTQYSTVSMLKTIELILGLPPMTQYDAAAVPMVNAFTNEPDFTPYAAELPRIDLTATNPAHAWGADAAMVMNLDEVDDLTVDEEQILNEMIWKSVKGDDSPMPKPVYWATHWAFWKPE